MAMEAAPSASCAAQRELPRTPPPRAESKSTGSPKHEPLFEPSTQDRAAKRNPDSPGLRKQAAGAGRRHDASKDVAEEHPPACALEAKFAEEAENSTEEESVVARDQEKGSGAADSVDVPAARGAGAAAQDPQPRPTLDSPSTSPCTASPLSAESEQGGTAAAGAPLSQEDLDKNVVIFDWDDTLLPSSFVAGFKDRGVPVSCEGRRELAMTGDSVKQLLEKACAVGRTMIITNADHGWVESSAQKYMPMVLPLLRSGRIEVISARARYEASWPLDPRMWKEACFSEHLGAFFSGLQLRDELRGGEGAPCSCRNVISLGDSYDERSALWNALQQFTVFGKSIKFVPNCSPLEVRQQQQFMLQCFDSMVGYEGHLDLMLQTGDQSP